MQRATSSQTIGPFFHNALAWAFHAGEDAVELVGKVLDGNASPINDAMLELWFDGAQGRDGFGLLRQATDPDGGFRFKLPRPKLGAPLAHVCVFARGCFNQHFTAVFAAPSDHVLWTAAPETRRNTMLATSQSDTLYRWDLRLQGPHETVFFEYE